MPESVLAKKMKRKPGSRAAIIDAPAGYEAKFFKGLERAASSLSGAYDWIQVFVHNEAELKRLIPEAARALNPEGLLWISFPKDPPRSRPISPVTKAGTARRTLISSGLP